MKFRVCFFIVMAMVCGFAPASAQGDGPTPVMFTHVDDEWNYAVSYDSSLVVLNESDSSISLRDADGVEIVWVDCYYDKRTTTYSPLNNAVDTIRQVLSEDYDDYELFSMEYTQTVQGYPVAELYFATKNKYSSWRQEVDYIVEGRDNIYIISMFWPEDEIANYWGYYYQAIGSFQVLQD